jgi:NAD-dependent deacetylase
MDIAPAQIERAATHLHAAQHIAILTGAGVSKESGVPTFRDALTGLWAQYNPQELATPSAFRRSPKLVWDWYEWRREIIGKSQPNAGHIALADLHQHKDSVWLITQNVDDLHEQAGSQDVIHLHGNIAANKCFADCQGTPTLIDVATLDYEDVPRCPFCNAYVRPDVVWFGEQLPREALGTAGIYSRDCDVMLVVGTSGMVSPASQLPSIAKQHGATLIEVNPDVSMITPLVDLHLQAPSGAVLPRVIRALRDLVN